MLQKVIILFISLIVVICELKSELSMTTINLAQTSLKSNVCIQNLKTFDRLLSDVKNQMIDVIIVCIEDCFPDFVYIDSKIEIHRLK